MSTNDNSQEQWTDTKAKIKAKWDKLSETDIEGFKGKMHLISERVQKVYNMTKDKAEQEYKDFKSASDSAASAGPKIVGTPSTAIKA